jgi:hypothetical protein
MARLEATEITPRPTRVTNPFVVLTGKISYELLPPRVTHQPVILNHQELDARVKEVNPLFDRAVKMGVGLKEGDFECSGSDSGNVIWAIDNIAICGNCLLEVKGKF